MTNAVYNENETSNKVQKECVGCWWRRGSRCTEDGLPIRGVLLWVVSWLFLVLPAASELPMPINVILNSSHFNHILKWDPGPGTPKGTDYRVSVGTERVSQIPVAGCEHVQHPLICNLTEAFSDLMESYTTMVKAVFEAQDSQPATITGFTPIFHMDPPLLTVTSCGRDLCVDLRPPLQRLRESYNNTNYQLKISSSKKDGEQFFKDIRSLGRETLKDLTSGREYCVSVRFLDTMETKEFNFSRPVCALTPGLFPEDLLISVFLCLLVIVGLVVLALFYCAGFFCLKKKPMPPVLTSIQHLNEALSVASLSSLLKAWPTAPPSGEKSYRQSFSDEGDEEFTTESTSESTGQGYKNRLGTDLLTSSSSILAPLSAEPKQTSSFPSNKTPDSFNLQLKAQISAETQSRASLNTLSTESLNGGRLEAEEKEQEMEGEMDVNLLTLTFGRQVEAESLQDAPQLDDLKDSEDCGATPIPLLQTAAEDASCCEHNEEEEIDEHCGYMGRLPSGVTERFL
ncbi:interleukin-10 receptor subunit beta-like isoform 1-T2 [Odontesthes bonariensis]|uniref:interleukin-10 receptor subunit beta-like n=1 Tax=Odontesthes bonariensis TaxID=219752 RepID=UPI003F58B9BC